LREHLERQAAALNRISESGERLNQLHALQQELLVKSEFVITDEIEEVDKELQAVLCDFTNACKDFSTYCKLNPIRMTRRQAILSRTSFWMMRLLGILSIAQGISGQKERLFSIGLGLVILIVVQIWKKPFEKIAARGYTDEQQN
jgi:hypothetical protein